MVRISNDLKTFEVDQEALNLIRRIDGEIGVVAVSGAQRTGKSFILNLLVDKFNGQGVSLVSSYLYSSKLVHLPKVALKVFGFGVNLSMLKTEICILFYQILKVVDLYRKTKIMMPRSLHQQCCCAASSYLTQCRLQMKTLSLVYLQLLSYRTLSSLGLRTMIKIKCCN